MTRCLERSEVTWQQCSQDVEDHRVSMTKWGLMLLHSLDWDNEEVMIWYSGPGYDNYVEALLAKRSS